MKNLYGLKDVGRTWNHHLRSGLLQQGWKQSHIDECLFVKQGILLILYVDDACIISPSKTLTHHEIKSLQNSYDLTDDGELQDCLGNRFDFHADGSVTLTPPWMIDRLLTIIGLDSNTSNVKYMTAQHSQFFMIIQLLNIGAKHGTTAPLLVVYRIFSPSYVQILQWQCSNVLGFAINLTNITRKRLNAYATTS